MAKVREPAPRPWCQINVETHEASGIFGSYGADTPEGAVAEVARLVDGAGTGLHEFARVTVVVRAAGGPWDAPANRLELECDRTLGLDESQRDRVRAALGTGPLAQNVDIEVSYRDDD